MAGREQIVEEMQNIMNKRLQKGTRSMYERAYKTFKTYEQNVPNDKSRGEKILMFLTEIYSSKCPINMGRNQIMSRRKK